MLYVNSGSIEAVIKKLMKEQLSEVADDALDILKDCTPKNTGELISTMSKEETADGYFVGTDTEKCPYANYPNVGTTGYSGLIYPTHAMALDTPWGPKVHVRTQKAQHYTTKAAQQISAKYGTKSTG